MTKLQRNYYYGLLAIYTFFAIYLLRVYFLWDLNAGFGFLLLPYFLGVKSKQRSWRYLVPSLLAVGLVLAFPVKTLLFIALLFTALLLIESHKGKLNSCVLVLLFIISPVFKFISTTISFPIRLWLTEKATALLFLLGMPAHSQGNIIKFNGQDFSVDEACAGLNMLNTSLILCISILIYYQKNTGKSLAFPHILGFLFFTTFLNLACNLLRILILVILNIEEGTIGHEVIGLICLAVYVFLPLLSASKFFFRKTAIPAEDCSNVWVFKSPKANLQSPLIHFILFIALIISFFNLKTMDEIIGTSVPIKPISGFARQNLKNGIIKFESQTGLIYIKPAPFYAPEHNPKICWSGSGYTFKYIRKETINGNEIYTGVLVKGKDKIYTAWWFQSRDIKTIDQFKWRWRSARYNESYQLINVNAASKMNLQQLIQTL
ncbi:exosortase N [Pedobacter sp. MC2016-14]|uniref:exosortase N n=1 Tax=Pedobacter sp. MC2016-14 TaxID=2897327 RepID=UPI001E30C25E|nr:exosortase N [Pedobacter sp. MC2016-14]MCD0489102.1 exosortase N [Pedobacter sp. MC2016-14]